MNGAFIGVVSRALSRRNKTYRTDRPRHDFRRRVASLFRERRRGVPDCRIPFYRLSVLLFCVLLQACVHQGLAPQRATPTHSSFCILVGSQDDVDLPNATVSLVTRDGEIRPLGVTDDLGVYCMPKKELEEAILLLVCHDVHFCGALRVQGTDLLQYDERYIRLAVFAIP
jgi:hypothetical protein